ncbi:MAG: hydrogenase maturation nickel metallochaperone HypA [Endomicrobiia bacterium]
MHEHSLAKTLAAVIFEVIDKNKPKKPKKTTIVVGKASGVNKEFLEHSLKDHVFKGTICENIELEFKFEEPKIKCKECGYETTQAVTKCRCGGDNFDVISGKDTYVLEVEFS